MTATTKLCVLVLFLCASCAMGLKLKTPYEPTWDSLDKRPMPAWFDEAKIGIFIHWGVFAVPSYGQGSASEWFWYYWKDAGNMAILEFMEKNYKPGFDYADFAPQFTAEFFDPNQWADILKGSGAQYVVLTSKHHEGFTNWPSVNSWNWNSMDVGPHRDLVDELATSVRNRTSMKFGLYHSLYEWFHPLYLKDKASGFKNQDFVRTKTMPELYDIVNRYKPEVIWSDGQWEASAEYWNSTEFIAWLYNSSPVKDTVVTNDRWGKDTLCKHGGYLTCHDHYNPGHLQARKWENCLTMDKDSWGFRRNAAYTEYRSIEEILQELVTTISCGGNLLINIGPTKEGTIAPVFQLRLSQMGEWLGVNGEAVYSSHPWKYQNDTLTPDVWYTTRDEHVYAFFFTWPSSGELDLGCPVAIGESATVELLGYDWNLSWKTMKSGSTTVIMPSVDPSTLTAKWLWVMKFTGFD